MASTCAFVAQVHAKRPLCSTDVLVIPSRSLRRRPSRHIRWRVERRVTPRLSKRRAILGDLGDQLPRRRIGSESENSRVHGENVLGEVTKAAKIHDGLTGREAPS